MPKKQAYILINEYITYICRRKINTMHKTHLFVLLFALLIGTACNKEKHFISDNAFRAEVEKDFQAKQAALPDGDLFAVFNQQMTPEEKEALTFLYAYMPIGDITDYDGKLYLDNIRSSFQAKQEILVANSFGKDLKVKAMRHGLKLNPEHFKEQGFYKTIGDVLYDISSLMGITSSNFLMLFLIICKAIGAAIGLFLLNWQLALLMFPLILLKIAYNLWMRAKSEKLGKESMEASKNYNTWFSDLLSGAIDIKLWNLNDRKTAEYEKHVDNMNEASKNISLFTAKNNRIMQAAELAFINLMYLPGVALIQNGQLTLTEEKRG